MPGVAFSVTYGVTGTAPFSVTVAESATGLDITIQGAATGGAGTDTASQMLAKFNADPVAGKIATAALFGADTGAGVMTAAVTKTSSLGQVSPSTTLAPVLGTSLDTANGNTFVNSGAENLVVTNTDAGTQQFTITSTDGLTVKSYELDTLKTYVFEPMDVSVYGVAPVITGFTTGLKLDVVTEKLPTGEAATPTLVDLMGIVRSLRDDTANTPFERKLYRRILHQLNMGSRRVSGSDQSLAAGTHDSIGNILN